MNTLNKRQHILLIGITILSLNIGNYMVDSSTIATDVVNNSDTNSNSDIDKNQKMISIDYQSK